MEGNGIKLADDIIRLGVEMGASDIHLEPYADNLRIRMRMDGVLHQIDNVISSRTALISRIKIMSGLDIAEKRIPQDGRSEIFFQNRKIDLRIASLPTIFGEKIVIRILDQGKNLLSVGALDFTKENFQRFAQLYKFPHGMVLLTGPTGSGKTTTLYATLGEVNSPERNIITIEDPVEYQLDGINQVAVNGKAGLTFAKGLRSIVRQDPDIIMIGEIRDEETAHIAVQAALTGHLILSTLHTNNAIGTITRLLDMGVERYQLAAALKGSVAQRLVRRLCVKCKRKRTAKAYELAYLHMELRIDLYEPCGCPACDNIGYRGRVAIQEVFIMDEKILESFVAGAGEKEIEKLALQRGMKSMWEDGRSKVFLGLTTVDELLKAGI